MGDSKPRASAGRVALAVFTGLVTVVVLSTAVDGVLHATQVFPGIGQPMATSLWWLAIAYRAVFTVAGGWVAGRLAPLPPMRAAGILTALGTLLGLAGLALARAKPELGPEWYAWAIALTGPPCSWLGGMLAARDSRGGSR
ncbi:MAG: hypothetical protein ABL977_06670 [Candidatus Eisenbacteria bacterium]